MISLGPSKFYGTSLPRPRIYTDVKFNDHRVDPPATVSEPLLSWAEEAHWSMGGLSFKRLRLQGKIEGNVQRLRSQREKAQSQSPIPPAHSGSNIDASPAPPPAPLVTKRRRCVDVIEEDVCVGRKSRLVRKLGDDFDRVASLEIESSNTVSFTAPSRRLAKGGETVEKTVAESAEKSNTKAKKSSGGDAKSPRVRTSPRFAKRVAN
ncbi:uncharacterized protein LOC106767219 [Vigna radiata var. radiata]|uniref:Uncharacterized protein LOC106767219 n=1 Tax=Vigna radiata var. radiata TaxID=3916 RepID=A0A1S3UNH9_VIGRR|nr:uncharacterized protein LOC106767219 [Vigna radiata var. radiata]